MASGTKLSSAVRRFGDNQLTCCICMGRYKNPKILACVHSFCESCLEEYYEGRFMNAPTFPCPLCKQDIEVPEEGIKGLQTNFTLCGMVEEFALQEEIACKEGRGPTCEICNEKEALHRCFDCVQNICEDCLENHEKFAAMKNHRVATLDDIRRGKVEVKTSQEDDDSKCHKHKGELTRFLCEPCFVQICQACTVIDHCPPRHHCIDSGEAVVKYKDKLNDKIDVVGKNMVHLQRSLHGVTVAKNEGSYMVHKAKADVQDRADEVVAKVVAMVRDKEKRLLDEIDNSWQGYSTSLDERAEAVQSVLQRGQHSLQTAEEITNAASDSDFLSLYPIISKDLKSLKRQHPSKMAARTPTWCLAFDKAAGIPDINLGTLTLGPDEKVERGWKLRREVSHVESKRLGMARGIAYSSNRGEIAVADFKGRQIVTSNTDGLLKWRKSLETRPWDVAFIHNLIVIVDESNHAKIYDATRPFEMIARFPTGGRPGSVLSVSVKMDGTIVAGDVDRKVLTEHRPIDGEILRTIRVNTAPYFLAVASNDTYAVSDIQSGEVTVVDADGATLLRIHPLIGGKRVWRCTGVCFGASGLYVAVSHEDAGSGRIYRYDSEDGKFLGCVLDGLQNPLGIAITEDERQITVVDFRSVKFFNL